MIGTQEKFLSAQTSNISLSKILPKSDSGKQKQLTMEDFVSKKQKISHIAKSSSVSTGATFCAQTTSVQQPSASIISTYSNKRDVGNICHSISALSDAEKYDLLLNAWKPGPSYTFPVNHTGR